MQVGYEIYQKLFPLAFKKVNSQTFLKRTVLYLEPPTFAIYFKRVQVLSEEGRVSSDLLSSLQCSLRLSVVLQSVCLNIL